MRVLLIHNYYRSSAPSGEDAVFENEKRMLETGHDVEVYSKHNDDLEDARITNKVKIALNAIWNTETAVEVGVKIRRFCPDVVHIHNTFPQISPSVYAACHAEAVPIVQTLHNYRFVCANGLLLRDGKPCQACVGHIPLPALRHRCYRGALSATGAVVGMQLVLRMNEARRRYVNTFIALTEFARLTLSRGLRQGARVVVKPNFLPSPPPLGIPAMRKRQAVFVGRLTQEKGVEVLLDAWLGLDSIKLVIVGDGELREKLEKRAINERLNVEFVGRQPRAAIFEIINQSLLMVVPSICFEGFPMVVLEAYSCGTPVVASNIGSLAEVIEDGVTGRLFEAGSSDALRSLLLDESFIGKAAELGRSCLQKFESTYTESINRQQLESIYRSALVPRNVA
jgi:glycosyltransferase involved in cell wall biosynthesis